MSGIEFAHSPRTLLHIAGELRRRGISPVEIFKRVGVPPSALLDANGWIPRRLCFALGEEAATVAGDRFFASRVGRSYGLKEFGMWGRLILGAENVGGACAVASRSIGFLHQGSTLNFSVFRDRAELRLRYRGRLGADPRQHLIGTLAVLRKIALLANAPDAVSVHFSEPHARGAECLEETHGSRLEFGREHDVVVIDRGILELPLEGRRESGTAMRLEAAETAEAIGPLVRQLLPYGRANLRAVAARLRVSERTMERRLRAWGFSFEEILDDVRRTEAVRHVCSGEYSALEIALLLGYSDPAHFTRAFRRWTGMAPRDHARVHRAARG